MRATTMLWGVPARQTAEDLLTLPDRGRRYESVSEKLLRPALRTWSHGHATNGLPRAFDRCMEEHGLGQIVPAGSASSPSVRVRPRVEHGTMWP